MNIIRTPTFAGGGITPEEKDAMDAHARLWQDATTPHDAHDVPPGVYELRIAREFDPLMEQARRVSD